MNATIAALATGASRGGIAVVRVSGPLALQATLSLAPSAPRPPQARYAYWSPIVDGRGETLDEGLFIYFEAPHSFSGEDIVELQLHGSPRLAQAILREVLKTPGVRLAQAGEFTRRAFMNGRIDLARAEAVADLVAADSDAAIRAAAAQVRGELSARVQSIRRPLVALAADIEGVLNFPEEAEGAEAELEARLGELSRAARAMLADAGRGRLLREGARIVLFGPPNAGKSSLFNALLGEARALVDEEPGTTRDALEGRCELGGIGLTFVDTAGLREAAGRVEALGVERAKEELQRADVALLVLPPEAREAEAAIWEDQAHGAASILRVRSKADTLPLAQRHQPQLWVSARDGEGLGHLREALVQELGLAGRAEWASAISERHGDALRRAAEALDAAATAARLSTLEVVAGELQVALGALGEVTGETATQELLDAVFQRFCIGK